MREKRKREVTIEFDEVFSIRRTQRSTLVWCAECTEQVCMVTPDKAAIETGVSSRAIYRWIETAEIHFTETADGRVLVCLNSFVKMMPQKEINLKRI